MLPAEFYYLFMVHLATLPVAQTVRRRTAVDQGLISWEELEGSDGGLDTVPALACRDRGKPWKISVEIVCVPCGDSNRAPLEYKSEIYRCV
jgi:hypothetical protein